MYDAKSVFDALKYNVPVPEIWSSRHLAIDFKAFECVIYHQSILRDFLTLKKSFSLHAYNFILDIHRRDNIVTNNNGFLQYWSSLNYFILLFA